MTICMQPADQLNVQSTTTSSHPCTRGIEMEKSKAPVFASNTSKWSGTIFPISKQVEYLTSNFNLITLKEWDYFKALNKGSTYERFPGSVRCMLVAHAKTTNLNYAPPRANNQKNPLWAPYLIKHGLSLEAHFLLKTLNKLLLLHFFSNFDAVFWKNSMTYCSFRKSMVKALWGSVMVTIKPYRVKKCQKIHFSGQESF